MSSRSGFSAVEAMLGCVMLAVAVLPLIRLNFDTGREAGFTEANLQAQVRVANLLAAQRALGWRAVAAAGADWTDLPVPPGTPPLETPIGCASEEHLRVRAENQDLVTLEADVRFTLPTDPRPLSHRRVSLQMVSRADASWLVPVPLTLETVGPAD